MLYSRITESKDAGKNNSKVYIASLALNSQYRRYLIEMVRWLEHFRTQCLQKIANDPQLFIYAINGLDTQGRNQRRPESCSGIRQQVGHIVTNN